MKFKQPTLFLILILFVCCKNKKSKSFLQNKINTNQQTIYIQPLGNIEFSNVNFVVNTLKKYYPFIILNKTIPLPIIAYYPLRNRFRADSLIKFLASKTSNGNVTIGITNKDISTTNDGIKDWGVMGLGYQPGLSCVISTFRLSKNNLQQQLFKIAIHELGHTQGLPHCAVKTCYMRDAEGKNPLDEETGFCNNCTQVLLKKGWTL